MSPASRERFYTKGLRFTCRQCHACCRSETPGWVYPSRREIQRMAHFLNSSLTSFRRRYMTRDPEGVARLRLRGNGDCVFWDEGCSIYAVRPRQCRTFPFWSDHLSSTEAWENVKKSCRGAGKGRLYSLEEIRSILRGRST